MTFMVGQKVVCVATHWNIDGETVPVRGSVYTIRAIIPYPDGVCGLQLVEICNTPRRYAEGFDECDFIATKFRPLTDTKTSISFTIGADPESKNWDNRKKVREKV